MPASAANVGSCKHCKGTDIMTMYDLKLNQKIITFCTSLHKTSTSLRVTKITLLPRCGMQVFLVTVYLPSLLDSEIEGFSCWASMCVAGHRVSLVNRCWQPLRQLQGASEVPLQESWHLFLLLLDAQSQATPSHKKNKATCEN